MIRFIAVASLSAKVFAEMILIRTPSDIVLRRKVKIFNYSVPYDLMRKQRKMTKMTFLSCKLSLTNAFGYLPYICKSYYNKIVKLYFQ